MFLSIALVLVFLPDPTRDALAHVARATVLRPVFALQRGAADREGRFEDLGMLRAERDSLATFLVGQANLSAENRKLRALLGLRDRIPYTFVPAEAVRLQGSTYAGAFLLTAGSRDGAKPNSPIITADGLVGLVRNVEGSHALGIDWTHTDFRASAMTPDGEVFGIVEPRGRREGGEMLALTGTAFHAKLEPGTLIVTSGRGGVYPRGIPIGTVVGPEEEEGGWRRSYLLRPAVTPTEMTHVLILGEPAEGNASPDLALAWGIRTSAPADTAPQTPQLPGGAVLGPAPASTPAPAPRSAPAVRPEPAAPRQRGPRLLGRPVDRPPAPVTPDTGGE